MHIIDAYCGVGPWATRDPLLPDSIEATTAIMDHYGVAEAFVFHNLRWIYESAGSINDRTLELIRTEPRFRPAFMIELHPHATPVSGYFGAMRAADVRLAWLCPVRFGHTLAPWQIGEFAECAVQHQLPIMLAMDGVSASDVHALASAFPRLRLILTGVGYRDDAWLYPLFRQHHELHLCLAPAYVPPLAPERFVNAFGSGRLLFGSGLPFSTPGGLLSMVAHARISGTDKDAIFAGTADRLSKEVIW